MLIIQTKKEKKMYLYSIEINPQLHDQNGMFIQLIRKKWTKFKESQ